MLFNFGRGKHIKNFKVKLKLKEPYKQWVIRLAFFARNNEEPKPIDGIRYEYLKA